MAKATDKRAPSTGLRMVATSSVGLSRSADASKRGPAAMPAQPHSATAEAADVRPRSTARREAATSDSGACEVIKCGPAKL